MSLLDVRELQVAFDTPDGRLQAVRGLDFDLEPGRTLGIVGESGSGKSVSMLAVLGLSGGHVSGSARFEGTDLLGLPAAALRRIRGARISMIFQDPLSSLHPLYRVGWQITEAIRAHERVPRGEAKRRAVELLDQVGIPQPAQRVTAFPHEFSGGMRQRVMIAMALALRPRILIADEPTTALDVTVQAQLLELLRELQAKNDMAIILITHDLAVVAEVADDVLVLYAGKAVERADRRTLFSRQHHPYSRGLLRSAATGAGGGRERMQPIVGQPPSLLQPPSGCPFHPRCPFVFDRCLPEEPPLRTVAGQGHQSACWLPAELLGTDHATDLERSAHAAEYRRGPAVLEVLYGREDGTGGTRS